MTRSDRMIAVPIALFLASVAPETVSAAVLEAARLDAATWESIATLDNEAQQAALLAAGHPSLLVRVAQLQRQSSERFRRLLASRPQDQQAAAWELSRYPGFAARMLEADSSPALHEVVADFPRQIRAAALSLRSDRRLVESMARLDRATEIAFAALLAAEAEPLRSAFHHLVQIPGAMETLTADLSATVMLAEATVMLAEAYDAEPDAVIAQLNLLRGDSKPTVPFANVAAAYRARYTYEPPAATRDIHVTRYYAAPYPYWYGYPLWYRGPWWGGAISWGVVPGVYVSTGYSRRTPSLSHRTRIPH